MPKDPLHRYPGARTTKPEEFEHILVHSYGAAKLEIFEVEGLNARGNWLQLQDIAIGFSACGAPAAVSFDACDFHRLQLPIRGHGTTTVAGNTTRLGVEQPCLTSAHRPATFHYEQGFEHFVMRVSAGAVKRKLALLLDTHLHSDVEFHPSEFANKAGILGVRRLLGAVASALDDETSEVSRLALTELEAALVTQMLLAGRHNLTPLLERASRDVAPACVKRAEAYIEANWHHPITAEDLVKAGGASARSLYQSFEKSRGCSPMKFVKRIRLERAREQLSTPDGTTSVAGTAFATGFLSTGHFAREYHRMFGELPSQTLGRSRV